MGVLWKWQAGRRAEFGTCGGVPVGIGTADLAPVV